MFSIEIHTANLHTDDILDRPTTDRTQVETGKDKLLKAYNAYVKPVLQYGVLAYVSTNKTKLETNELKIKRLIKTICFKRTNESIKELRQKRKIYFVRELLIYELLKLLCKVLRKECISAIVLEAKTEKNLHTILNKRVLARQIPVQPKGNQKTFVKVRIIKLFNFVLRYYPNFVTKTQSCTQYQLQNSTMSFWTILF